MVKVTFFASDVCYSNWSPVLKKGSVEMVETTCVHCGGGHIKMGLFRFLAQFCFLVFADYNRILL